MQLEKITYTAENSTPQIVEAIRARVQHIGGQIIVMHDAPKSSPFTVNCMFDRIEEIVDGWDYFDSIVDLRDSQRTDAATRNVVNERSMKIAKRQKNLIFIIGGNVIMRATATFIIRATGIPLTKVCESVDEAKEFLLKKRLETIRP